MLRRLFSVCLIMSTCGCNPPAPSISGGASSATPAIGKDQDVARINAKGADSGAAAETATGTITTTPDDGSGGKVNVQELGDEGGPSAETETAEESQTSKKPAAGGVEAAMLKLRRARTPELLKKAAADLEAALDQEPDHVEGLLTLVQVLQFLSKDVENDEATDRMIHKSVALLEKATKADADLLENPGFKRFAATVYSNDARALAREKNLPEALASLRQAIEYGMTDFDEIEEDKDLVEVRKLAEYAPLVAEAKEKVKAAAEKEVAELFEKNKPFEFTFDLEDISGNKLVKADFAGKVMIVDIWGTWCPPCRAEIPHFVALDKEYRRKGLQIVGLNQERGEDEAENVKVVKEFCEENSIAYPCALIDERVIEQVPEFEGFPTTLFLDHTGKVRLKAVGLHDISFLRAAVEALLKEKNTAATDQPVEKTSE